MTRQTHKNTNNVCHFEWRFDITYLGSQSKACVQSIPRRRKSGDFSTSIVVMRQATVSDCRKHVSSSGISMLTVFCTFWDRMFTWNLAIFTYFWHSVDIKQYILYSRFNPYCPPPPPKKKKNPLPAGQHMYSITIESKPGRPHISACLVTFDHAPTPPPPHRTVRKHN